MRIPVYTIAVPLLAAFAFAQDKDATKSANTSSDRPAEMKTESFSGELVDASCAGGAATTSASAETAKSDNASADRSASTATNSSSCSVSAGTARFGLKLKDGTVVKFDDVGNMRTQDSFKAHKKWSDMATANKPIRVKASGVREGDRITLMAIN